jgi:polyvinyl alcohol dehydrogenase (cytochrome)
LLGEASPLKPVKVYAKAFVVVGVLLAGCSDDSRLIERSEFKAGGQKAADNAQGLADEQRAREEMPGKAIYQAMCDTCHDGTVARSPHTDMIAMMTPESILASITDGVMKEQAANLTDEQRTLVAEYLAGQPFGQPAQPPPLCAATAAAFDLGAPPRFAAWGMQVANTRYIPSEDGGLDAANLDGLRLKWAFAFPGANRARSQPTVAGGAVLVGAHEGAVYALDRNTGCVRWRFPASAEVRTGIVVEAWQPGDIDAQPKAYFGDHLGNVYAVNARSGELAWRRRADDHPNATITATPTLFEGTLYVAVSSLEVAIAVDPLVECCRFRGSILALDAATGEERWRTYSIAEAPRVRGQNPSGTDMYGPSGAAVWNSPAIDAERRQLYFGTAENASSPATATSDAVIALDVDTGAVRWSFQGTANDAWNQSCDTEHDDNCPVENGPDFDFGAAVMLVTTKGGRDLVIGGQKSGIVHALDPDTGAVVWQARVGRGGIQGGVHFGMAAADGVLFVPISDMPDGRAYPDPARPGMHALDLEDGTPLWSALIEEDRCQGRDFCHQGVSQAITLAGDLVLAGGMDGVLRAHDRATGEVLWEHDTSGTVDTVAGVSARGGSLGGAAGPVVDDGLLLVSSGYGLYFHMPGNVLLAFENDDGEDINAR